MSTEAGSEQEKNSYGLPQSFKTLPGLLKQIELIAASDIEESDRKILNDVHLHMENSFPAKTLMREKLFFVEAGLGKNGIRINDQQHLIYGRRGGNRQFAKDLIQSINDASAMAAHPKPNKESIQRMQGLSRLYPKTFFTKDQLFEGLEEMLYRDAPNFDKERFLDAAKIAFPKSLRDHEGLSYFEAALAEKGFYYDGSLKHKSVQQNPDDMTARQIAVTENLNQAFDLAVKWAKTPKSVQAINRSRAGLGTIPAGPEPAPDPEPSAAPEPASGPQTATPQEAFHPNDGQRKLEEAISSIMILAQDNQKIIENALERFNNSTTGPRISMIVEATQQSREEIRQNALGQAFREQEDAITKAVDEGDSKKISHTLASTFDAATENIKSLGRKLTMVGRNAIRKSSLASNFMLKNGGEWIANSAHKIADRAAAKIEELEQGHIKGKDQGMDKETSGPSL